MAEKDEIAELVERLWSLTLRRVVLSTAIELANKKVSVYEEYARTVDRMAGELGALLGARNASGPTSVPPSLVRHHGWRPEGSAAAQQPPLDEPAPPSIESAVAQERVRLGQKIHDGLTQEMTSLVLQLEAAQRLAARDPQSVSESLSQVTRAARACLSEVRSFLAELHSEPSGPRRLFPALKQLADEFRRDAGLPISFKWSGPDPSVTREMEEGIVGTIREALANARKHSGASLVLVSVQATTDAVEGVVFDDGAGFDYEESEAAARQGGSFGLVGMRQRIAALDGTLAITSHPGKGTRICLSVPLNGRAGSA